MDQNDTEVVFYECDAANLLIWREVATIARVYVACVIIKTPRCGRASGSIVTAYFQVHRLSDNRHSTPHQFLYLPERPALPPQGIYSDQT